MLTPQEADQLFIVLERLKAEGRAHALHQPQARGGEAALRHRATVLRHGKKVATCDPAARDRGNARAHDGRRRDRRGEGRARHASRRRGSRSISSRCRRTIRIGVRLDEVSLEVRGGEILGIAGVAGNGQDELFAALSGERLSPEPFNVVIDGTPAGQSSVTAAPPARRGLRARRAARPRHRAAHEVVGECAADRTCRERHGPPWLHQPAARRSRWSTRRRRYSTCARPSAIPRRRACPAAICRNSSSAAKSLREPGVLVVSQPTWGVDAGAAATIRQALIDLAARGAAVLVISQDLDETRRDCRPHRGDVPRPAVRAARCRSARPASSSAC